ncbi:hypothetical protein C9374_003405 [Naegleria lovaniensis]|uniref:Rhodanese domain-containing protein n=1 Tax=Naegleria lovaniensis TaxID=51637 RepID=A0AA88GRL6_NAELO|nr:uncharacterized protein C9374_003405 [Naegleria lovaniensis]KAG2385590.1 hypothetical protein C9374_003405 [Naegleria lovaniensis]
MKRQRQHDGNLSAPSNDNDDDIIFSSSQTHSIKQRIPLLRNEATTRTASVSSEIFSSSLPSSSSSALKDHPVADTSKPLLSKTKLLQKRNTLSPTTSAYLSNNKENLFQNKKNNSSTLSITASFHTTPSSYSPLEKKVKVSHHSRSHTLACYTENLIKTSCSPLISPHRRIKNSFEDESSSITTQPCDSTKNNTLYNSSITQNHEEVHNEKFQHEEHNLAAAEPRSPSTSSSTFLTNVSTSTAPKNEHHTTPTRVLDFGSCLTHSPSSLSLGNDDHSTPYLNSSLTHSEACVSSLSDPFSRPMMMMRTSTPNKNENFQRTLFDHEDSQSDTGSVSLNNSTMESRFILTPPSCLSSTNTNNVWTSASMNELSSPNVFGSANRSLKTFHSSLSVCRNLKFDECISSSNNSSSSSSSSNIGMTMATTSIKNDCWEEDFDALTPSLVINKRMSCTEQTQHTLLSPLVHQCSIHSPKSCLSRKSKKENSTTRKKASFVPKPNLVLPTNSSFEDVDDDDSDLPLISPLLMNSNDDVFGMEASEHDSNRLLSFSESSRRLMIGFGEVELAQSQVPATSCSATTPVSTNSPSESSATSSSSSSCTGSSSSRASTCSLDSVQTPQDVDDVSSSTLVPSLFTAQDELMLEIIPQPKITGCQCIDSKTLLNAMNNPTLSVTIIDCRFSYEYNGGHIQGAINISTPQELIARYFASNQDQLQDTTKQIIVFHYFLSTKTIRANGL